MWVTTPAIKLTNWKQDLGWLLLFSPDKKGERKNRMIDQLNVPLIVLSRDEET